MFSPFGNGHHLGATPGTWRSRETGPSHGYLAPAGGARRRHGWATGQPVRRGRARPLHLIHGGALPGSARPEWLCQHRHGTPGNRRNAPPRLVRGHHRVRARSLSGCGTRRSMGPARRVPGRGCGNAGPTVTGRAPGRTATRSPYRVRMSMIGRQAVDTRAACPVKRRKHRCLLARSHPHRVLASGVPGE